jgi:hypothetical protein
MPARRIVPGSRSASLPKESRIGRNKKYRDKIDEIFGLDAVACYEFLFKVMNGEIKAGVRTRVQAAEFILEQRHGKAAVKIWTHNTGDTPHVDILALVGRPGVLEFAQQVASLSEPGEPGSLPLSECVEVRPTPEAAERAGGEAREGRNAAGDLGNAAEVG